MSVRARAFDACVLVALGTVAVACRRAASTSSVGDAAADAPADAPAEAGYQVWNGSPQPRLDCPITLSLAQHEQLAEDDNHVHDQGRACIEFDASGVPQEVRAVACTTLARPYFAEPLRLETDRCNDDGSSERELRAVCLGERASLVHVRARREGDAIIVSVDGQKDVRWRPNACIGWGEYRFVVPESNPRFAQIRASWGNVRASERCRSFAGTVRQVDVLLHESMPPNIDGQDNPACGRGPTPRWRARVELLVPSLGIRRDLGMLQNGSADYEVYDLSDVGGLEISASDDGTSRRLAFQMGDRIVYLTPDNAMETVDLPCGVNARLRTDASGQRSSQTFLQ